MKKAFLITFSLFVLSIIVMILKWDLIQESSSVFAFAFFFVFIPLALIINFPFLAILIVPIIILVIWVLVRKIDSDLIKVIALSMFMFFTGIQVIYAVTLLTDKTTKEEIIESFSGKKTMLASIQERIKEENPHIKFHLVKQSVDEYEDGELVLPLVSYVFDVAFTDEDGTVYNDSLETSVACIGGDFDDCFVQNNEFKHLKTAEGKAFEVDTRIEEEYWIKSSAEDFEINRWHINPHY